MGNVSRRGAHILQSSKRWRDVDQQPQISPERNIVWSEPAGLVTRIKRVSVVYYLSRNGHLEHPHFMEVPLSCPDGLYLKDVLSRLNFLRGKGVASMYSWSSKRSYKNGYVWQDLSEDDYIHPVHGLEYVLKGSEIPLHSDHLSENHAHTVANNSNSLEVGDSDSSLNTSGRKNHHWSSYVLHECKVYRTDSAREEADASTQTGERRRGHSHRLISSEAENENQIVEVEGSPPVDSSPETLESLLKADKQVMVLTNSNEEMQCGRLKASSVLMQLITCGSFSFRHCGTIADHHGISLITTQQHNPKMHVTRDEDKDTSHLEKELEEHPSFERVSLEDRVL